MKQIIIATAIALAIPAAAIAEETTQSVPQAANVAVQAMSFDLAKALRITPSQQKVFNDYEKAEVEAWGWENRQFGLKNSYIAATTNALDGLYKSGLSQQQLDLLLRGNVEEGDDSQQNIDWMAREVGLNDEQKALYAQYAKAGAYKIQMDAKVSGNLFVARKALNSKLTAQQLRIASDYGLIDARPAPRDEWSKFMGYVK